MKSDVNWKMIDPPDFGGRSIPLVVDDRRERTVDWTVHPLSIHNDIINSRADSLSAMERYSG